MSETEADKLYELIQTIDDEHRKETDALKEANREMQQTLYGVRGEDGLVKRFNKLEKSYYWNLALLTGAVGVIVWLITKLFSFG